VSKFAVVFLAVLYGCTGPIRPDVMHEAENACASHGGLGFYEQSFGILTDRYLVDAYCNNGMHLEFKVEPSKGEKK
jgi:hypothetical protein